MSSYDWLSIASADDYDQLTGRIDTDFAPHEIIKSLKGAISPAVKGVLIEYGYVDKDYRSTFYHFYAKKGRRYRADCVRLHFFDELVSYDVALTDLVCGDGRPQDHYFGYVVLRPTLSATLGRSILSPDIRQGARGLTIHADHQTHLLGYKLSVTGFPSMAQHTDISVCAHVSCWAILRHFSERFSQHREHLIHEITMLAHPFDPGGLTPALGLDVLQAERIFHAAGSYPLVVHKKEDKDASFMSQLMAYLESGFPLFVAMEDPNLAHAIVVIGHAWSDFPSGPPFKAAHAFEQLESLIVVDDNQLPYHCIPKAGSSPGYGFENFSTFIVPLPDKIHYPADAVDRVSLRLHTLLKKQMGLPDKSQLIRRYFVTTQSALRRFVRENASQLGEILVGTLMRLQTAQFVWIVEYASPEQWALGHIGARAVLDATASLNDAIPMWLIHNDREAVIFDRINSAPGAQVIDLDRPAGTALGRMELNLRPVRSKT